MQQKTEITKNLLSVPGVELGFLDRPTGRAVIIPTELPMASKGSQNVYPWKNFRNLGFSAFVSMRQSVRLIDVSDTQTK
jgi:hypothetical protein